MKYLVIGAGGTGGAIGAYLAHAGQDVALIARGRHLEAMRENGLHVIRPTDEFTARDINAYTMEEYSSLRSGGDGSGNGIACPDVIFVCVKGYSIEEMIPFITEIADADTIVIPILNIYGTGARMQRDLPGNLVTDGCIYIASEIIRPGEILMKGDIFRIVYGLRKDDRSVDSRITEAQLCRLRKIEENLNVSGIRGILSDNIERDALRKFAYVSPQGACGLYYNIPTGPMQVPGEERDCFAGLVKEIDDLAHAMGIDFGEDIVKVSLNILDTLDPSMTTSMQRDIAAGKSSEIDGLIYEVVRMGERFGADLPIYRSIVDELRARGIE